MFFQDIFLSRGWEHTILKKKWMQWPGIRAHICCLFSYFFPRVLRGGREKGALKVCSKNLNRRYGLRPKSEQIGNQTRVCEVKLKQGRVTWRQKLAACVKGDIRPPTMQRSRSDHMCNIQKACLLLMTHTFILALLFFLVLSAKLQPCLSSEEMRAEPH